MAMPRDSASAPMAVICALPVKYPAYTTPTAMPSGILCSVTASTNIVVREKPLLGPSGVSRALVQVGDKHIQQKQEPDAEPEPDNGGQERQLPQHGGLLHGRGEQAPDGCRHHDPAANPVSARCTPGCRDFFIKNTQADPIVVPAKGMRIPMNTLVSIH